MLIQGSSCLQWWYHTYSRYIFIYINDVRISSSWEDSKISWIASSFIILYLVIIRTILLILLNYKLDMSTYFIKCSILLYNRILALEKLGAVFNQVSTALKYTPRKFAIDTQTSSLIVIETDHNALSESAKMERKQKIAEVSLRLNVSCKYS